MIKYVSFLLMFTISFVVFSQKNKKPNIIVLFADDISAREFPIYGSDTWSPPTGGDSQDMKYRAKTPVMDKLANEGLYIKTAWAAVVCSPSRAMMMTGRYAHKHKWWSNDNIGKYTNDKGKMETFPLFKSSPNTIGHIAKQGGYSTFWVGKTQMRNIELDQYGFDEGVFTAGESRLAMENPYSEFTVKTEKVNGQKKTINLDNGLVADTYDQSSWYWKPHVMLMNHPTAKKKYEWWPNTEKAKKEYGLNTYGPDVELEFALDFMTRKVKANEPFFLYHTSHLGHDAMDFLHPSEKNKWPGTPVISYENGQYKRTTPNVTGSKGKYDTHGTVTEPGIYNHINYIDYQVSLYLQKMKDLKIDNNTIFIICADNGTSGYGKNSDEVQKGVHVPFIIYAPGFNLTKKGEQDVLVNIADVLPTIAEIAGVKIPSDYEINGESLWPFLTTNKKTHREWVYGYKGPSQIIRGTKVLKDGRGTWYDVRKTPTDLISFSVIKDWSKAPKELVEERDKLNKIVPQFDLFKQSPNGPLSEQNQKEFLAAEKIKSDKKKGSQQKSKAGKKVKEKSEG